MLRDALRYPRSGESPLKTILIGGVLSALSWLVLPTVLLFGYYTRVLRSVMSGDDSVVPAFDDWWDMFIDGLGFAGVVIVYGFIPTALVAIGTQVTPAVAGLGGLLGLAVYYLLPAGLANYAREDRFFAAFSPGPIGDIAFDSQYAVGWLMALAVLVVGGAIAAALSAIFVGVFVVFYIAVTVFYIYGRSAAEAYGPGSRTTVKGGARTA